MARPKVDIDGEQVLKLAAMGAHTREIAAFFECSHDTITRRFASEVAKGRAQLRIRLRSLQLRLAENLNPTMLIWLGKQMLGQSDVPEMEYVEIKAIDKTLLTYEQFCEKAGYPRPFPRQVEMAQFGGGEGDPRILLGARGYGKTDYVTVLGTAYEAYLEGPGFTQLIISKSRERNKAIISEIATALEKNGVLLSKKNSTCVRIDGHLGKDHSVEVLTVGSSFRGRHPKRIKMDDPVTEEDTSEAQRLLVKKKYDEAYKLCKNIVIIGQPAHAFDLYAELGPNLKTMRVPHGSIPELDADLEAMKLAGVDPHSIQMSYHLVIPADGAAIFSNLKFIDKFPNGDTTVAFIDPSDGGDYTAVTILRAHFSGFAVIGFAWKKAWYHCLDDMVPKLLAHRVGRIAFETNVTGSQPIEQLRSIPQLSGIGIVGVHSVTNKQSVIIAAGSYAHLLHLSKESDRVYRDQVVKYDKSSKYDDAPDSLARCLEWLGVLKGK